jgi:hypothetical protein
MRRLGLFIVLVAGLSLSACGKTDKAVETTTEPEVVTEAIEPVTEVTNEPESTEAVQEIPVIYADNSTINLYLNRYNEANAGSEIVSTDFEQYYHHGSTHKDQIVFSDNTVISAYTGGRVSVYLDYDTPEEYKEAFKRYARGYKASFSEDVLEDYWSTLEEATGITQFEEFEVQISKSVNSIDYINISGEVE